MNYQGKSILLVDDDVDLLTQMAIQLRSLGFEVIEAEGQHAAEALLERQRPDAAVVDLMMEHEDSGFVLAHHVKRRYPDVPVIVVTAVTSELGLTFDATTSEERAWIRADALLNKPVRFEQLERELRRLLPEPQP
ncbi:MAG TPA: response regulator [Polyangiaceae bacterium]|nr:response regulator [Polyangiaceae bacterium]